MLHLNDSPAKHIDELLSLVVETARWCSDYSGRFSIACPIRGNHHSGRVEIINMQLVSYCFRNVSERRYALTKPSSNDILLSRRLRVISVFRSTDSQLNGHPVSDKQNNQCRKLNVNEMVTPTCNQVSYHLLFFTISLFKFIFLKIFKCSHKSVS